MQKVPILFLYNEKFKNKAFKFFISKWKTRYKIPYFQSRPLVGNIKQGEETILISS